MLRKLVAEGLLSVMLAAALFSLFRLPVEAETVYREITGMEELTDGRYVLITPQDIAPGTLAEEEGVISAVALTAVGDTVTDTAGGEWDLTVTENRAILTDAHGVSVTVRDIKTDRPTAEELRAWHARSGLPLKRFFNTSGLQYKALGLKDKLPTMTEDEQLALLATDGMLVKRPLLVADDFVLVGFREKEWEERL